MRAALMRCCALLLPLLLSGCGAGTPADRLDDYLGRLARPLEFETPHPANPAPDLPPRWEALQLPLETGSIDGLDFLALRGCALQQTVARRNSSLGRVAPPSQRLLLELEFLRLVDDCISFLRDQDENALATVLAQNAELKTRQLPARIFNATLGNEEYRDFWRARKPGADYPEQTSSLVIDALAQITASAARWLRGEYTADGTAFELQLSDVSRGDGGELLAALALQAAWLDAGSALLHERASDGNLCAHGVPGNAKILRTVATTFFIGGVQPWSARLNQRSHTLLPPLRELEVLLSDVLPVEYQRWRGRREAALSGWSDAPLRHVKALQALLGPCFSEFEAGDDSVAAQRAPVLAGSG